ncbi:MAG: nicotinamide mononucleotide transporter [Pseudodesulfovibrio sp.]|jgi:hypothetical protein|uniref:Nicotinamide mononucleotide transporter n=1 Tax=Pseudodesulfovibrio indicus TaxID=1716143 RepID=A0A126QM69_9BACT|nr:nicotinamide mononucleotide transporter [Pseudodesulfovibrio indicus]AMK11160.1 hypothetical protein AWY79_08545 [Pseudodesulfovibrio indicus]TDT92179.1 nicotinamide mononucleotide transporter [Pseudodesulfovibrio indicus]
MDTILQIWGGSCYLLNKICFAGAERSAAPEDSRKWRLWSWTVFLVGLPAWVTVFIMERNWIAATVEAGGAPAMLVGLIIALRGRGGEPRWLDRLARLSVIVGLGISLREFGGITTAGQVLELCIAAGFLMGTYLMAKENVKGYLWFMLGNISCAALMGLQGYSILMTQQLVSLVFVADAWRSRKAAKGKDSSTR